MDDQIMSYQVNRIKTQETNTRKRTYQHTSSNIIIPANLNALLMKKKIIRNMLISKVF